MAALTTKIAVQTVMIAVLMATIAVLMGLKLFHWRLSCYEGHDSGSVGDGAVLKALEVF